MQLTKKDIEQFQQIMFDQYGITLSDTQAEQQARQMLDFLSAYLL